MKSIQNYAKVAGILYILIAVLAGFVHGYIPSQLFVAGDATATADNIIAQEGLFRASMVSELILLLAEVVLTIILYKLLKPVNKTLSLIAAVSRLIMTTIHGVNMVNLILVLLLLSGVGYLSAFTSSQLNSLAMLFLNAYQYGFTIGIIFLVLHASILGYLIFKSGYFPKVLGILFLIASLGYFVDGFSHIFISNYKTGAAYLAIPIALSEIAFPLWLLIKGVNIKQWQKLTPKTTEA